MPRIRRPLGSSYDVAAVAALTGAVKSSFVGFDRLPVLVRIPSGLMRATQHCVSPEEVRGPQLAVKAP